jgi:transcriptional regulator with XRE-family HTH domain
VLTLQELGRALADRRHALREKQSTIAQQARLSDTVVSDLEHGRRLEGLAPFLRLVDALGLDIRFVARAGGPMWLAADRIHPQLLKLDEMTETVDDRDWLEQQLDVVLIAYAHWKRNRPLRRRAFTRRVRAGKSGPLTSSKTASGAARRPSPEPRSPQGNPSRP